MSSPPVETVMPDCPVKPQLERCIGVFWDVVDFPFPEGLSPALIYHKTNLFVRSLGCTGDVSIMAYVDKQEFDDTLVGFYEDAGFTILPRQGDEHARYRSMIMDIAMWEGDMSYYNYNYFEKSLMVLSKDIEKGSPFFSFLQSMACPFNHVFLTLDHDPPPRQTRRLERICFSLPSERIDQSGTLLASHKRKRREESSYYSNETLPSSLIIPPSPVVESTSDEPCTHVFWDGVDFPLPPYDASMVSQSSLKALGFHGDLSLTAYVDEAGFCGETKIDGITIIPQRGDKEARIHGMVVDIVLWAMENPATYFEPRTLMVISKDIKQGTDFLNALEALGDRHYNVLLGTPNPQDFSLPMTVKSLDSAHHCSAVGGREEVVGFSNGLASLYHPEFNMSDTMIFWDVQGCPTDFSILEQVLVKKRYYGNVIMRPYVDIKSGDDSFGKASERFWIKSRIRVGSQGDKYAKVTRMLLDILFWAMNNDDVPQNLMLISEPFKDDTKCDLVIRALERRGFNVIFRPSDKVASIEQSTIGIFESLCKSVPDGEEEEPDGIEELINPSIKLQGRILTDLSRELARETAVVFWLVEKCPANPYKISSHFSSALEKKGYFGICSTFTAYTDQRNVSDEMRKVYRESNVYLRPIPKENDFGMVTNMLLGLISWRRSFMDPANLIVISEPFKDPLCDRVVEALKLRGFNVLFEQTDYMLTLGSSSSLWSAKSLLDERLWFFKSPVDAFIAPK